MKLLETYQELIESDSNDISICWKIYQIFFHLLSATSGYGAAILFYILWNEIFAGNCPLWAEVMSPSKSRIMPEEFPLEEEITAVILPDWRQKIIVNFKYTERCKLYHFVSLTSCLFGIAWLTLFAMCGKGGYDSRIFVAPWSVVPPAMIFQFIFAIITMFVVCDLEYGYFKFADDLESRITFISNETHQLANLTRQCEIVENYLEISSTNGWNICQVYPALRILSWIMAWSWLLGLMALIYRVVRIEDFKLLTVSIYKLPDRVDEYSSKSSRAMNSDQRESTAAVDNE